uniref:Uncharacterized protein n=1 Tax=Oryza barthii TaxID=65489 RepID=A0A0D3HH45_9ORYZ
MTRDLWCTFSKKKKETAAGWAWAGPPISGRYRFSFPAGNARFLLQKIQLQFPIQLSCIAAVAAAASARRRRRPRLLRHPPAPSPRLPLATFSSSSPCSFLPCLLRYKPDPSPSPLTTALVHDSVGIQKGQTKSKFLQSHWHAQSSIHM